MLAGSRVYTPAGYSSRSLSPRASSRRRVICCAPAPTTASTACAPASGCRSPCCATSARCPDQVLRRDAAGPGWSRRRSRSGLSSTPSTTTSGRSIWSTAPSRRSNATCARRPSREPGRALVARLRCLRGGDTLPRSGSSARWATSRFATAEQFMSFTWAGALRALLGRVQRMSPEHTNNPRPPLCDPGGNPCQGPTRIPTGGQIIPHGLIGALR
jgi:hypothetical protein